MTCRHTDRYNNPACSSYRTPEEQLKILEQQKEEVKQRFKLSDTPDSANFHVEDSVEVGDLGSKYLVLKVSYPSCKSCSYEGVKVMVFEGMMLSDAIKWKVIDPHFREPGDYNTRSAPGPIARFPASEEGWKDAVDYARLKSSSK